MTALQLCYLAAGVFFTIGLLSGIWKYWGIVQSEKAEAHEYVSVLHRAALMYSFASILLAKFVELNPYSEQVKFYAVAAVVGFFAFAQTTYFIHAILKDTDNQFRKPYVIGGWKFPPFLLHLSMFLLIAAELGGFLVLFWGYVSSL
ncbi:MAG: hypothetical protein AAF518_16125 [Spirochaetota bacterium]